MKTTTVILTLICSIFMISISQASVHSNPLKDYNTKGIIALYIEVATVGNKIYNNHLFTNDFEYIDGNKKKFSKKLYLNYLKLNEGLSYNCTSSYKILDETTTSCLAKTIHQYTTFSRVDYITLVKTNEGWKISKITTSY